MFRYPRGMTENIVPSTVRTKKSKALSKLRKAAEEKGITVVENAVVVITPEGLLNVLGWSGEAWEPTHASRIVKL